MFSHSGSHNIIELRNDNSLTIERVGSLESNHWYCDIKSTRIFVASTVLDDIAHTPTFTQLLHQTRMHIWIRDALWRHTIRIPALFLSPFSYLDAHIMHCWYRVRVSIRPSVFLYAKNIQSYSEYRVAHASGQLNRTSDAGNCAHGSSPRASRNGNELSVDNILWSRLIASGPSERRQHERRQLRSKRRQREFIPSRLENVVKELVRSLWVCSVCNNQQCRIVFLMHSRLKSHNILVLDRLQCVARVNYLISTKHAMASVFVIISCLSSMADSEANSRSVREHSSFRKRQLDRCFTLWISTKMSQGP